jgi:hypothetical protein
MSCKPVSCQGKTMNSGRYKGKKICNFPSGMGGFANCNKKYIDLDEFSHGCSDNPEYLRNCCKLSTCVSKTPKPTNNSKQHKKQPTTNKWYWILLTLFIIFLLTIVILVTIYL